MKTGQKSWHISIPRKMYPNPDVAKDWVAALRLNTFRQLLGYQRGTALLLIELRKSCRNQAPSTNM
jgi:hypothetical protein